MRDKRYSLYSDPSLTHFDCQSRFGIGCLGLVWTLEGASKGVARYQSVRSCCWRQAAIRLKGHKYTNTVHGVAYNGTFEECW
jgi:hypothetical protein